MAFNSHVKQGEFLYSALRNPKKFLGGPNKKINYRSGLEYKFIQFVDCNPHIKSWDYEAIIIEYLDESRPNSMGQPTKHRYILDFNITVVDKDGKETSYYVEIKPFKETQKPTVTKRKSPVTLLEETMIYIRNICKWKHADAHAKAHGHRFQVITDNDLKSF